MKKLQKAALTIAVRYPKNTTPNGLDCLSYSSSVQCNNSACCTKSDYLCIFRYSQTA